MHAVGTAHLITCQNVHNVHCCPAKGRMVQHHYDSVCLLGSGVARIITAHWAVCLADDTALCGNGQCVSPCACRCCCRGSLTADC